jgi:ferredoxin--NADP+ reductase
MNNPPEANSTRSIAATTACRVAIVGAGPSGCFTAQALRKSLPEVDIAVFDALPTPYGLIRYGIAPDHQGAKAVSRQFDRLFQKPGVDFVGNVKVGVDVPAGHLLRNFHAVVFATGLAGDRALNVAQDEAAHVIGAGEVLRFLNSDPDSPLRLADGAVGSLGDEIAIIGTGNVAVDVARLLSKAEHELSASDVDDHALRGLAPRGIKTIHILGRCEPHLAKWDASMLKELAAVEGVDLRIDGEPFTPGQPADRTRTTVDVRFQQVTDSIRGDGGRTRLVTHHAADPSRVTHVVVDTVITALGFEDRLSAHVNPLVLQAPNVFEVGGRVSGRLGNLAENRKLAAETASAVIQFLQAHARKPRAGLAAIRAGLPSRYVTFEGWRRIDEAEIRRARPQRCRTKFTTREQLLSVAESSGLAQQPAGRHAVSA